METISSAELCTGPDALNPCPSRRLQARLDVIGRAAADISADYLRTGGLRTLCNRRPEGPNRHL